MNCVEVRHNNIQRICAILIIHATVLSSAKQHQPFDACVGRMNHARTGCGRVLLLTWIRPRVPCKQIYTYVLRRFMGTFKYVCIKICVRVCSCGVWRIAIMIYFVKTAHPKPCSTDWSNRMECGKPYINEGDFRILDKHTTHTRAREQTIQLFLDGILVNRTNRKQTHTPKHMPKMLLIRYGIGYKIQNCMRNKCTSEFHCSIYHIPYVCFWLHLINSKWMIL